MTVAIFAGGVGEAGGLVNAAEFDGSNDYVSRGSNLSGVSDSSQGILSMWIEADTNNNDEYLFSMGSSSSEQMQFYFSSGNIFIQFDGSGSRYRWLTGGISTGTVYHLLFSWDMDPGGSKVFNSYINDASSGSNTLDFGGAFSLDYTSNPVAVGTYYVSLGNSVYRYDGKIGAFYFAPGQYLDFSTESNRRKFVNADGTPVNLGADGSTPTGSQPAVFLNNKYDSFESNLGSGGDFTVTGSLDDGGIITGF